jgi:hypothetical protein
MRGAAPSYLWPRTAAPSRIPPRKDLPEVFRQALFRMHFS